MPQFLTRTFAALAAIAFFQQIIPAQQADQSMDKGSHSITLNVVTSPVGSAENLTAQDFQLLDNKAPRPLTTVRRVVDSAAPAKIIIVVDAVNIAFSRVAYVRSEVEKFFKTNGGHLSNPTTFAVVTDTATNVQQGFTNDGNGLSTSLAQYPIGLREVRRSEGIWGADERTQISLKALNELTTYAAKLPGRKLILWISPGWPLLSGTRIDLTGKQQSEIFGSVVEYSRQLRLADITLYNINSLGPEENLAYAEYYQAFLKGVPKASDTDLADLSLQVLAAQSGGLTLTGSSDVAGNIAKCIGDTRDWFEVTFNASPTERRDEYHHVQIKVDKANVEARTRDGYYAEP